MTPETSAIIVSASVTAAVGAAGAVVLSRVARRRPSVAALGGPIVLVAALAAGVAIASRSMLIGEDDYRTLVFVLLAGAPMAVLVGLGLARRVWAMERDAATERSARQRAVEVEESRRETVRWLSHDLRTPLAGIRALAESLEDDAVADPHAAHGRIVHEVDRMDAMVEDIAELSRLHGSAPRRVEPAALDDLVSDAVATVLPLAAAAGIEVSASDLSGAIVDVDARGVTRAVTNVLRNAIQHTPEGGAVRVRTTSVAGTAAVEVADRCGGIPQKDARHVFEPGWRGDGSRHERGMGLGLTIAREVGRMHGGDATLANLPDGSGCVFTLSLPSR
ncbi:MAG: HAMP domain-containing sensor histidine kinase [Ornithinibacter sp.]